MPEEQDETRTAEDMGDDALVLRADRLRARVGTLFTRLHQDDEARRRFVENPAGAIAEHLGAPLGAQRASESNRLLFTLISNPQFRDWVSEYTAGHEDDDVTPEQFKNDFVEAVARFADDELIAALASNAIAGGGIIPVADDAESFSKQYSVAMSDHVAIYNRSYAWTENKTKGHGIEEIEHVINPEAMRVITEQLVDKAADLRQAGRLRDLSNPIQ